MKINRISHLFWAVLAVQLSCPVSAEWVIDPTLSIAGGYNDNYTLETSDALKENVVVGEAEFGFVLVNRNPTSTLRLVPKIRLNRFGGAWRSDLDSEEEFVDLEYQKNGETTDTRIWFHYANEVTFASEFIEIDFDDEIGAPGDSTGELNERNTRETLRLRPSWFWEISPRSEVGLVMAYRDVSFENISSSGLQDYDRSSIRLIWSRRVSERLTTGIDAYVGQYDPAPVSQTGSDTYGFNGRMTWQHSESTASWIRAGLGRTDSGTSSSDSEQDTFQAAVGLRRESPYWGLRFDVSRYQRGSALGSVVDETNFRATVNRRLRGESSFYLGARYKAIDGLVDSDGIRARDIALASIGFAWVPSSVWRIAIEYNYSYLSFDDELDSAKGNELLLLFRYTGKQQSGRRNINLNTPWRR